MRLVAGVAFGPWRRTGAVADGSRHGEFLNAPVGFDAVDVRNLAAGQALMTSGRRR